MAACDDVTVFSQSCEEMVTIKVNHPFSSGLPWQISRTSFLGAEDTIALDGSYEK